MPGTLHDAPRAPSPARGSGLPGGLRFDRNELSGAFGDLGTSLPLLIGMVLASGLHPASVLLVFGALQIATGVFYRMPMPVQPLKAVAAIVIAQRVPGAIIAGGGLAIGAVMLLLSVTGLLGWLARVVPHAVVRGLQFGLGLQLSLLALRDFIPSLGASGYALAIASFAIVLLLLGNRRWPPAPLVIALGVAYAAFTGDPLDAFANGMGVVVPSVAVPGWSDIGAGFLLLALPQIPLSLGNSVLATRQVAQDLFPEREPLGVRRIGATYAAMNLVAPLVGGVPVCHGSGGMAGHFALGGRTGGSVVVNGAMFVALGLFFSGGFASVVHVFPRPMLGVLLLVEGLAMLLLVRDLMDRPADDLGIAVLVGLVAVGLPYGYLIGMVLGVILSLLARRGVVTIRPGAARPGPAAD